MKVSYNVCIKVVRMTSHERLNNTIGTSSAGPEEMAQHGLSLEEFKKAAVKLTHCFTCLNAALHGGNDDPMRLFQ